jgi:putative transposase
MQYFKEGTECFDDYYPCLKNKDCNLVHVYNWILELFISLYNYTVVEKNNYYIIKEVVLF